MIVWLASYPRSGNSFLRIVLHSVFDVKTASLHEGRGDRPTQPALSDLMGFMSFDGLDLAQLRRDSRPVFIKTLHPDDALVRPEDRVVYVIRDGREACLSYAHHLSSYVDRPWNLDDVLAGEVPFGAWADHVRTWHPKARPGGLLIPFEDLTREPQKFIDPLATLSGLDPVSDQIPGFEDLQAIDPRFFRSGQPESWREVYDERQHLAFWLTSQDVMLDHGYDWHVPPEVYQPGFALAQERHRRVLELEAELRRAAAEGRAAKRYRARVQQLLRAFARFQGQQGVFALRRRRHAWRRLVLALEALRGDS